MKIAILGGKTILDVIFLNCLSEEFKECSVECYGDSGEISFGSKVLNIKNIVSINPENHDIIINFSKNYFNLHEKFKASSALYFNYFENSGENCVLLPDFACIPMIYFLDIFKESLDNLNVLNIKCVAEFGKEALKRFHKEIQDSHFNIIRDNDGKNPLAFSFNCDCLEGKSLFENLDCEQNITSYLQDWYDMNSYVKAIAGPVNKASVLILDFELKKEIELEALKKRLESAGFIVSFNSLSSIMVENDDQIHVPKIRKNGKKYSVTLIYDALFIFVNWLIGKMNH